MSKVAPVWHYPRCLPCQRERRRDYALVNTFGMEMRDYIAKWRVPRNERERAERPLVDGAVNLSGMVLFWRGVPYLPPQKVAALRAILQ